MSEALSAEQYEIIQLLHDELQEFLSEHNSTLNFADAAAIEERISEGALLLNNLSNAAELAGLPGFSLGCERLRESLEIYLGRFDTARSTGVGEAGNSGVGQPNDSVLDEVVLGRLQQWPGVFLGYVGSIGSPEELNAANSIIELLSFESWPNPLPEKDRRELFDAFSENQLPEVDESSALPTNANGPMVSLLIPDDVRQELVDGMMIELPSQVSVFEASITSYLASHAFEDLTQAQRMAHTLKGAANVVGVSGVANLMHYIEDLLEQGAKQWEEAPDGFDDVLLNASDCLASMAEYLCGLGPEPEDSIDVMQQVLDWLVLIKSGETVESDKPNFSQLGSRDVSASENKESVSRIESCTESKRETESDFKSEVTTEPKVDVSANAELNVKPDIPSETSDEVSTSEASLIARPSTPIAVPKLDTPAVDQEDVDEKHFIHVPETTAQELLRISGESQIVNNQLNAQVDSLQTSIKLADRYHRKIRQMAADLEVIVQTQSALSAATGRSGEDQLDPLEMERYSELHSFSNQLLELTADSFEAVSQIDSQISELNQLSYLQRQQNRENQTLLLEMRLIPISSLSSRFNRCVRQASRLTHKSAIIKIIGESTLLDSRVLNRIADPIMHLLRNAVDHGLERNAGLRLESGKSKEGSIQLSFSHTGETISIECKDDGVGLDYEAILQAAKSKGLVDESESIDEAMLNQLILMPGFSTRKDASQTSGRGIGLDAVVSEVRALKGNLTVQSVPGEGCCFTLTVPTSIISGHAVLVPSKGRFGQQALAIVTRNVEQILFAQKDDLLIENGLMHYDFNQEKIPILELNHLANIKGAARGEVGALLVTRRPDGTRVGVAVENILASQDMVIKPLNDLTCHPDGVIGATILGDGNIAPVVDLQELPGMGLSQDDYQRVREQRDKISSLERDGEREVPIALIVDDSLSARRSLAQFMSDIGMDVRTAKDGFEAISVLSEKKPALMLVDLEMPRMNGLELTAHIRSRDDIKDIPIIMITSRATEKHRSMAEKAGVNSYLNKPWSDEDLMATIQGQIA